VSRIRLISAVILVAALPLLALGQDESEFYAQPKTVPEFWRAARFEIRTGNFERAAERIKGLLDMNPDEKTLFDLVDKPLPGAEAGMGQFLRLRNVPRWYAKNAQDKEAKQNVELLISKITTAVEHELSNPERIRRYANQLAGPPEESAFALKELRRSGKAVPPVLATMTGEDLSEETRAGILAAIPQLGLDTVPGFVAYLPHAKPTVQAHLIDALQLREDFRSLPLIADTDPVPTFWYLWGNPTSTDEVKKKAREAIAATTLKDPNLERDPELRTAPGQLTAYARQFYMGTDNLTKLVGDIAHHVWIWDGKVIKEVAMSKAQATEHYGLKYARWALDLRPDYVPAQKVFFGIAIEYQTARSGGSRPLAKSAPELHAALATAPFTLLAEMLDESIRDKKTPVVLAVVRVLGERTEVRAAHSGNKPGEKALPGVDARPSLLVRALDYPDPRVQFAAADALLRVPGLPTHGRNAQIVKILAATLAADPLEGAKPKVLLGDPDAIRADGMASVLQRIGYDVEVVITGRQLVRRLQTKADADLIIVDQHLPNPMLVDLLPQLRADRRARTLPLWVVASPEGTTPVNLFTALARLAAVVAFIDLRDNPALKLPPAEGKKQDLIEQTDFSFAELQKLILSRHAAQVKFMQETVARAGFTLNDEIKNRIEYLSIQTFSLPYLSTFANSLLDQERIVVRDLLPELIRDDLTGNPVGPFKGRLRGDELPSREEAARIVKLMFLTADAEAGVPAERTPEFRKLWDSFWDPVDPKIPPSPPVRYPEIEAKVARMIAPYSNVRVVPAVLSEAGMREELAQGSDAKAPPISPAEKKENAKAALAWLRKMAVGELTGYKVTEAEPALRGALKSDELAALAIDAVAKIPSKEVQLDLANLAVAPERPIPIRTQAAAALVEHIQTYGRFVTGPQADAITEAVPVVEDLDLKARLLAALGVLKADGKTTGDRLKGYVPKPAEAPKDEVPPPKEKEDPKENPEKK
jgi:CheY-like chemotaxis protein